MDGWMDGWVMEKISQARIFWLRMGWSYDTRDEACFSKVIEDHVEGGR